jgi:hypothetical protein
VFDLTNLKGEKRRNVGKLNNELSIVKDFIKADLHVDTFSMDIQNIILYNVQIIIISKLKNIKD